MPHSSKISVYISVSKGWGPNARCDLQGLSVCMSQEVNQIPWGGSGLEEQGPHRPSLGLRGGGAFIAEMLCFFNCFPRSISFHCILGSVSFSHKDKLVPGKYVNTVLYQDRTFSIVVYKLRASN